MDAIEDVFVVSGLNSYLKLEDIEISNNTLLEAGSQMSGVVARNFSQSDVLGMTFSQNTGVQVSVLFLIFYVYEGLFLN